MLKERLKLLREQSNLSQEDVAKVIGVSRTAYVHYETGRSVPPLFAVEKFSKLFNCTSDFLLGLSDFQNEQECSEKQKLTSYEKRLLEIFRELDDVKKGMALQRIMDLAKEEQAASQEYLLKNA